jgi:hypothetical protein
MDGINLRKYKIRFAFQVLIYFKVSLHLSLPHSSQVIINLGLSQLRGHFPHLTQ